MIAWCADLGVPKEVEQGLIHAWRYAQRYMAAKTETMSNCAATLQSGVEMVEILHELNMDAESLVTAMLFPALATECITLEQVNDDFGDKITKLLTGVL